MRYLMAIALALGISGLAFAAAASLDVDGGTVQAGGDITLSCDPDGVDIGYQVEFSNSLDGFVVTDVDVEDVHGDCAGKTIEVQLTDSGGFAIVGASGTATAVAGTTTVPIGTDPLAANVYDVHVAIYD